MSGRRTDAGKLHSYWDTQTVDNAFGETQDATIARRLAAREPDNWQLTGDVETWAEQLANDIMPLAREARQRLEYKRIRHRAGKPRHRQRSRGRKEKTSRRNFLRNLGTRRGEERDP